MMLLWGSTLSKEIKSVKTITSAFSLHIHLTRSLLKVGAENFTEKSDLSKD